jgi:predicted GIY-YIG superfamily endonuclease
MNQQLFRNIKNKIDEFILFYEKQYKQKIINNIYENKMLSNTITMKIKQIYKEFGLRDVRQARRLLGLDKKTLKQEVDAELRDAYKYIWEVTKEPPVYMYTIKGESRKEYQIKAPNGKNVTKLSAPTNISMSFQSRTKYDIKKANIVGIKDIKLDKTMVNNKHPFVWWTVADYKMGNEDIVIEWMKKGDSPLEYKVNSILSVSRRKVPYLKQDLVDMPMYHASVELPFKEFNGFRDSGNMICVPESILHHLQKDGYHKKTTLKDVLHRLGVNEDDDLDYEFYSDDLDYEFYSDDDSDEEGGHLKKGYTSRDVVKVLDSYGCRCRLLDVHQRQFLTGNSNAKKDKHLKLFVAIVYNNHLYYCSDERHVRCIAEKAKAQEMNTGYVPEQVYEKTNKHKDTRSYETQETHDLIDHYIKQFKEDNTIRLIKTENGRITRIEYDDKVVCANPEKSIMLEILGEHFKNENTTILGELEFKEFFPNHKKSKFTKQVFDQLTKHGNIVKNLNMPMKQEQHEYDINKCRTACWMDNRLGDYEVFDYQSQIEDYAGELRQGWYYCVPFAIRDLEFFMRGSCWYSADFIKVGQQLGFNVGIEYQLVAYDSIPFNTYKPFVQHLVNKYPKHYKKIVCSSVGYRGKTQTKVKKGYVETNFDMAVSAFWDNNDEMIGFMYDKHVDKKQWKTMKGKLCNIEALKISDDTEHYIVEYTDYTTLYENDLPIYNKILENEYLRLFELKTALGGRIIKLKTDAVVVEGEHNKITLSDEIGGYKHRTLKADVAHLSEDTISYSFKVDTNLQWNIVEEQADGTVMMPEGSCVVTALAGYGKSHLIKQQPEYFREDTIRLGFTNVSCDNLADKANDVYTLNSYFGIDFTTGKGSEKKLKNLKNVKCIIVTEVFMIPSYIMGYLAMIKEAFPNIKFICEGDPEQIRPVKEEHLNWLHKQLFYKLCDRNLVKLLYNKRNNETENYHKILNGESLNACKFSAREPQRVNICKTNKMRVTINHLKMNKTGHFIAKSKKNAKSQDIWLTLDTPIMCVNHNKTLNLKNGKMYDLVSIQKDAITIGDHTFTDDSFAEHFVVAFAVTNHKVQGITIREHYNIYEWDSMSKREMYTAYSRTADANFVKIVRSFEADDILWKSLCKFFKHNYCIYKWTCKDCNHIYVGHTNDYEGRKKEHNEACNNIKHKNHNNKIYKYMREYGNWKMEILEHFYAPDRKAAEIVEQSYIDKLQPSLNMCAASISS